jgi:hypothetical protein
MHRIGRSGIEQILSRIADEQRQRQRLEELVMVRLKKGVCLKSLKGVGYHQSFITIIPDRNVIYYLQTNDVET